MAKSEKGNPVWNSTLRRKKSLNPTGKLKRAAWKRSKPIHSKEPYTHKKHRDGRSPLKQISKKQKKSLTKRYYPVQSKFLRLSENRYCWICIGRSMGANRSEIRAIMAQPYNEAEAMLRDGNAVLTPAQEVHHWGGRIGRLLDFVPWFVPECRGCREWPHDNARQARALDLLAPATAYNVFPENPEELWESYLKTSSLQSKNTA